MPDVVKAKRGRRARGSPAPELLAELFNAAATGIAVGGTSGKSTVTGMIGWILHAAGRDPTVMNGAVMKNFVSADVPFASALVGARRRLRQRGRRKRRLDRALPARRSRCSTTSPSTTSRWTSCATCSAISPPRPETVVLNLDDDETRFLAAALPPERLRTYSFQDRARRPVRLGHRRGAVRDLLQGRAAMPVRLQVPGRHNAENALAALAAAEAAGVPLAEARRGARRLHRPAPPLRAGRRGERRHRDRRFRAQSRQDRRHPAHAPRLPRPAAALLPAARLRPAADDEGRTDRTASPARWRPTTC